MTCGRALAAVAALALLAACDKDKDADPPAELVDIKPTVAVDKLWSSSVGGGGEKLRLALDLAEDSGTLYAASRNGEVVALDPANGRKRWQTDTKIDLSAGPGVGGGLVTVGTNGGKLVALDAASGKERWRVQLSGEVLAPPLVTDDRVVVRTVDGRLHALAAADGKELWMAEDLVPRLTLRGTSPPVRADDAVICGFDSGKVMSVGLADGATRWQAQVSSPRGRSELERLADVDGTVHVSGADVYAVGYQGRVAMISVDSGQIWWARDLSSYRGLALDGDQLYVATSDGDVVGLARRDGSVVWQQQALKRRGLGAPAVTEGGLVVVGDFDGYLHFMDRGSGQFVARQRMSRTRISAAPLVIGDRIIVIDDGGQITAYRSGVAKGG
jgi:outer membrane protein assembly factor BamB